MVSLATTPTLILFDNIQVLHLELTTRCQASCAQCARMDEHSGYSKDHDVTLQQIQQTYSVDFVKKLHKVFACGNFGDPAAAKECLQILQWFRSVNPSITIGINTNGGLRGPQFWTALGQLLSQQLDYCVFSIDGLADTNGVYRQGVQWSHVMANATAFVSAGGRAHWDMLVFAHNQHQVDHCRDKAKEMGFVRFRTKVSARFAQYPLLFLQPPAGHVPVLASKTIQCHAVQEKSVYMAATGEILPCCFIGSEVFRMDDRLRKLVQSPDELAASWTQNPHAVCSRFCAVTHNKTTFASQFQEDSALC